MILLPKKYKNHWEHSKWSMLCFQFLWQKWKTWVVSMSAGCTDNENSASCRNSNFININKKTTKKTTNLLFQAQAEMKLSDIPDRKGRWWRGWIKGQQQKSLLTHLASSLDTREGGEVGIQILDSMFVCCQFLSTALSLTLSQSQTTAPYQTASWQAALYSVQQKVKASKLVFLCSLGS